MVQYKIKSGLAVAIAILLSAQVHSQQLPIGYIPYFSQRGNTPGLMESLTINRPEGFKLSRDKTCTIINPYGTDSLSHLLPPTCRGIISDKIFGEFIIEFDYKLQPGIIPDTSGFYFLAPVKSNITYYAIAFSDDTLSFLYVDDGSIRNLGNSANVKISNGWNNVRIERNILNRNMIITMNGDATRRVTFTDPDLV